MTDGRSHTEDQRPYVLGDLLGKPVVSFGRVWGVGIDSIFRQGHVHPRVVSWSTWTHDFKGAFGSVYRGLNVFSGETVAVKQIKLKDIPKSDVNTIMVRLYFWKLGCRADKDKLEIDLLKNLNVSF